MGGRLTKETLDLQIGAQDPREKFPQQWEFLSVDRTGPGVSRTNYVAGRAGAKTTGGVLLLLDTVKAMPGLTGYWSEPRHGDIDKVFMPALERIVPSTLWQRVNKQGYRYIQWWNGHRTDLVARNVDNRNKKVGLGPNYAYGIDDEAADMFDAQKFAHMHNAIREPKAPYLFHDSLSTPQLNGYYPYCHLPKAHTIYATSYDNPFVSDEAIDDMVAGMSPEMVEQEIMGKWMQLTGRMWKNFIEKPWPFGNIIEGMEFDVDEPWSLWCDFGGAQSAFQIVQWVDPLFKGKRVMAGRIPVCVAEITPNNMNFEDVLEDCIIPIYCKGDTDKNRPFKSAVGTDVATPGLGAPSCARLFRNLGWDFVAPKVSRELRKQNCLAALCNNRKLPGTLEHVTERRFCVAANKDRRGIYQIAKQHYGERKQRGILNMFRNDTFPDPSSRDVFNDDKKTAGINAVEDDRDAWGYGISVFHPQPWAKSSKRAAG